MTDNVIKFVHKVMGIIRQENVLKNVHKRKILLPIHKQNFVLQCVRLDFMLTIKQEVVYLQLIVQMIWLVIHLHYNVLMVKIVQQDILLITIYSCV